MELSYLRLEKNSFGQNTDCKAFKIKYFDSIKKKKKKYYDKELGKKCLLEQLKSVMFA